MTHVGYRMERHNAHMAAVCAVQLRHQLERVERVLAQHEAWQRLRQNQEGAAETIAMLNEMQDELVAEMMVAGQQP